MEKLVLNVNGISCGHCESVVKKALSELDGVKEVLVDLSGKTVSVKIDGVSIDEIKNIIEEQGFDVI